MISILIADDHAIVRSGYRAVLEAEEDFRIVGEARDGAEAVGLVIETEPDVVLMDIRMPVLDGLEATRRISASARVTATKVIVLTTFDLDEYVFGALRSGASAFLLKGIEPQQLIDAVRVVAAGDALLEPSATRRLIEAYVAGEARRRTPEERPDPAVSSLTRREIDVLRLVAAGLTNAEIADALYISPLTTKSHISRMLTKLGARDRTQLVVLAYESGLVVAGQPPST